MEIESQSKDNLSTLFDTAPTQIKTIDPNQYQELVAPPKKQKPYMKDEMSAAQNKVISHHPCSTDLYFYQKSLVLAPTLHSF